MDRFWAQIKDPDLLAYIRFSSIIYNFFVDIMTNSLFENNVLYTKFFNAVVMFRDKCREIKVQKI